MSSGLGTDVQVRNIYRGLPLGTDMWQSPMVDCGRRGQSFDSDASDSRPRRRGWSAEEDDRLRQAVGMYGLKAWSIVAAFVGRGRSRAQCSQRWLRGLDPTISRDVWSEKEDDTLRELVATHGVNRWVKVAKSLPGRCDVQCRYRFRQLRKREKEGLEEEDVAENVLEMLSVASLLNKKM